MLGSLGRAAQAVEAARIARSAACGIAEQAA